MAKFKYCGEFNTIQFYDMTSPSPVVEKQIGGGKKIVLVGSIIVEVEYWEGIFLPQPGHMVRFNSGKYNGIYQVSEWIFCDETKMLRIKVKKV